MDENDHRAPGWRPALSGIVSAGVFLAVAEVVGLFTGPGTTPLVALGEVVIDSVPGPVKDAAIALFGIHDKTVLYAVMAVVVALVAAGAGLLEERRPPGGLVVGAAAGVVCLAAAVTRPDAGPASWLPSVLGAVAGGLSLVRLTGPPRPPQVRAAGVSRREFVSLAVTGTVAVFVGAGARLLSSAGRRVTALREAVRLPAPRTRVPIPDGADFAVPGISALITPNSDFYRIDTALAPPTIDPAQWRLNVTGLVDRPVELTFDELLAMGLDEHAVTLTCVSNPVGGTLVGSALWWGVPVRDVLRMAGPRPGADMVLSRSVDGFTASTPLESLTDDAVDAILAVAMNGEPLPIEHGFPVRMVVPGLYGYVSATKWLTELKVTTFAQDQGYWTPRGWSARGPIKLASRIDTPRDGAQIGAGTVVVAGVAWAQGTGISRVEVRVDGQWLDAEVSAPISADTWVQWRVLCDLGAGEHEVAVRATDADGRVQTSVEAPPAPDGATGWHTRRIAVT